MRTTRSLSFLFFVCTVVVFLNTRLAASISCQDLPEGTCENSYDHFGRNCTVSGSETCSQFFQACAGYCDPTSIDPTQNSCNTNNGFTTGVCWCATWSHCQCAGSSSFCSQDSDCCTGLVCNQIQGYCSTNPSPILINLRSHAVEDHLTSAVEGVLFDIDADGVLDQVAWTHADSPVAFLVLDRNHNGTIDDGEELFGNFTPMADGSRAANGFEALKDLDNGPGGPDGQIDAHDPAYSHLRLWLDRNHNGISEADELITLPQAGVTRIFTRYQESRRVDRYGNAYRYVGGAMLRRNGGEVLRRIFDVYLVTAH